MQLIQFFNMNSGLLLTWKFWSSGWHLSSLHWLYNTIWVINPQFLLTHVDSICPLILTCSFSWYVIHQVFLLCSAGFSISISKKLWSKFCSCFADSWASQLWLGLNIFYADLHLTNMSLCFTEAFRVSTQFMMSSAISVLGGVLLRPKVTFVEQVTYVLWCSVLQNVRGRYGVYIDCRYLT